MVPGATADKMRLVPEAPSPGLRSAQLTSTPVTSPTREGFIGEALGIYRTHMEVKGSMNPDFLRQSFS